jgi:Cu+-exporting ATPase
VLPAEKRQVIRELRSREESSRWPVTASTTRQRWPKSRWGSRWTGTDVAIESADITLLRGDLRGIVRARRLSRATMKNIRQNLFLAFIYNIVGVPVAAGILYPFLSVLISPIWASAAMTLSSVSVIGNALRLRRVEL